MTFTSRESRHASLSPMHRSILLLVLPLFVATMLAVMLILVDMPGHRGFDFVILTLVALVATGSFWVLLRNPEQVDGVALITVFMISAVFLHRVVSALFGPVATDPDYSLFRPVYAFLPLAWISYFVFLKARDALLVSLAFWLALMAALLIRVVPDWDVFRGREDFHFSLLLLALGSPMFILLLALLPRLQHRPADSSTHTLEREVKLAAQIDEARQRLEVALVGSRDALFDWIPGNGGGIWVAPRFYDLIGRGPGEFTPTPENLIELVHPDDVPELEKLKEDQLGAASIEIRLLTRTRGYRYFSVRIVRIGSAKKGVRFGGSVRDVHARKVQEERARIAREETNDFAKRAAHNLNAPIRRMRMLAERSLRQVEGESPDPENLAKNLRRIVDNSSQSQEFIDALLDYAGSLVLREEQKVDLNQTISEVLADVQDQLSRRNAVVDVGEMPTVLGDDDDLRQLFHEIMDNALKYSPRTPAIRIESQSFKDAAVISVHDRGIGVPPEHLYGIFEPLMRLHSRDEYAGDGLGLSIARNICKKYNGQIWAESEPDQGTVVRVRLRTEAQSMHRLED